MLAKTPQSILPDLPRLEDISPTYAELSAKAATLAGENSRLETEKQRLALVARESRDRTGATARVEVTAQDARVAEILGDVVPEATSEVTIGDAIRRIDARLLDVHAAQAVLDQRLSAERMRASAIICAQIKPAYHAVMTDLVDKMTAAVEAGARYRAFADALNRGQVAWAGMNPMGVAVGGLTHKSSPFSMWLREACRRGFGDGERVRKAQS